jgi:hypothetical protein
MGAVGECIEEDVEEGGTGVRKLTTLRFVSDEEKLSVYMKIVRLLLEVSRASVSR